MKPAGILVHERRFQRIANANEDSGSRDAGLPRLRRLRGRQASDGRLRRERPALQVPVLRRAQRVVLPNGSAAADLRAYDFSTNTGDYAVMDYSGSGALKDVAVVPTNDIQIPPGPTPDSSNSGCGPRDFVPASRPRTRWPSSSAAPAFAQKAQNAEAAGYDAAIIFNEGRRTSRATIASGSC